MIVNNDFRELEAFERIVIPKKLRKKLGLKKQDKLHVQIYKDTPQTINLKIEKE